MKNIFLGKDAIWHKDSKGFWLAICIAISAIAGWLMVHIQVVQ